MVERKKASPLSPVKVNDGAAIKENITMSENPRKEISLNMVCVPSLQAVPLHAWRWGWCHIQHSSPSKRGKSSCCQRAWFWSISISVTLLHSHFHSDRSISISHFHSDWSISISVTPSAHTFILIDRCLSPSPHSNTSSSSSNSTAQSQWRITTITTTTIILERDAADSIVSHYCCVPLDHWVCLYSIVSHYCCVARYLLCVCVCVLCV